VTAAAIETFLMQVGKATGRAARVHPVPAPANDTGPAAQGQRGRIRNSSSALLSAVTYNSERKVIDGRDSFLAYLAMREFATGFTKPEALAGRIWQLFLEDADQTRPKGDSRNIRWAYGDALKKAKAVCRKFAGRLIIRQRFGSHPVRHLHSFRRRAFWTENHKARHQVEAGYRVTAPSALAVNRAMLSATSLAGGQCEITVRELVEQTKLSESAVKIARRKLLDAGLWIAQRGIYVPFPLEGDESSQATDGTEDNPSRVHSDVHPLYHREVSNEAAILANPANDDGIEDSAS
jgi:hypothetical protein